MKRTACDLASCLFCRSCPAEWLELTQIKKQTVLFKRGEQLFMEAAPVTGMYFMISGAVKVHRHWGGKEMIVRFTGAGDIIGVRGFGDEFYHASATALEESKLCFIPGEHLQASLNINPSLSKRLMQYYASELQSAETRMSDLAHRDVKGRLIESLLELAVLYGEDERGFLRVTLSRQDLASYAGTTYDTIFRIFTEWISSGWIETDGKRVRMIEKDMLKQSSH